jgi:hypothetical protein
MKRNLFIVGVVGSSVGSQSLQYWLAAVNTINALNVFTSCVYSDIYKGTRSIVTLLFGSNFAVWQ